MIIQTIKNAFATASEGVMAFEQNHPILAAGIHFGISASMGNALGDSALGKFSYGVITHAGLVVTKIAAFVVGQQMVYAPAAPPPVAPPPAVVQPYPASGAEM